MTKRVLLTLLLLAGHSAAYAQGPGQNNTTYTTGGLDAASLSGGLIDVESALPDDFEDSEDPSLVLLSGSGNKATITGHVFYNDRRNYGRFEWRRDNRGNVGEQCGTDGDRDGVNCANNLLGAWGAVVDFYERDTGYFAPTSWNCKQREHIGSAVVQSDGSFEFEFVPEDDCNHDDWSDVAIEMQVRLRYCGESYCFSMNESGRREYVLGHPGATEDDPIMIEPGETRDGGGMVFAPSGQDTQVAEDYAIAANYYATLVDSIIALHQNGGIPFFNDEYGEVHYVYPSNATNSATAKSATKVVLAQKSDWVSGQVVAHEYGHVVHLRAWDDDEYGWNGIGVSWDGSEIQESKLAFKEGWANFLGRVVHATDRGCDGEFDDNTDTALFGNPGEGAYWVRDVTKFLCDWYDTTNDDDTWIVGTGDHFAAGSLYSIWQNLRYMWVDSSSYGGDRDAGLDVCDYIDYYLRVRKSVAAVGETSHINYERSISDMAYQNYVYCGLPNPAGWTNSSNDDGDDDVDTTTAEDPARNLDTSLPWCPPWMTCEDDSDLPPIGDPADYGGIPDPMDP